MKTLKVSIILCILFGISVESATAQVSQKLINKPVDRSKSALDVKRDTAFSRINASSLYNMNSLILRRNNLTVQKDLTIVIPAMNYFDFINNTSSISYRWAAFIINPVLPDYIITDTANKNWSSLILNPPSGIYNYYNQSKKTNYF